MWPARKPSVNQSPAPSADHQRPEPESIESLSQRVRPGRGARAAAVLASFSPLIILLIWEALSRADMIDQRFFPAPSDVVGYVWSGLVQGSLIDDILATLRRVVVGYMMGGIPALLIGLALGLFRPLRMFLGPVFSTLFTIPKIAILPLILFIFGIGDMSKFVLIAIGAFFPIFFNTLGGVLQSPKIYFDVARSAGASGSQRFFTVALPAALPSIFTGLRLAAGISFVLIAAAEFVGANNGVGYYIWSSWQVFSVEKMFAGVIVISLMGYLSIVAINWTERLLVPYQSNTITG